MQHVNFWAGCTASVTGLSCQCHLQLVLSLQACYGHTEGAAGVTGVLLAVCAVQHASAPGIMCLRQTNPYVAAVISDWKLKSRCKQPLVPRQVASAGALMEAAVSGVYRHT